MVVGHGDRRRGGPPAVRRTAPAGRRRGQRRRCDPQLAGARTRSDRGGGADRGGDSGRGRVIAVTIPTTDVNSESAIIVRWYVEDRSEVAPGDAIAEIETSKAIIDVAAQHDGVLLQLVAVGAQINLDEPLAYLFENLEALERHAEERAQATPSDDAHAGRITEPARRRAAEL